MRVPELELELEFEFNATAELELELVNSSVALPRRECTSGQPARVNVRKLLRT